ncbi:MAG: alanyl-tRNA editing protein [Candidatus Krumholzibacteriota bacterium]|nr:alanyl-tRNA editing protein [Candidatus Krumholzibacteriota bacterium]
MKPYWQDPPVLEGEAAVLETRRDDRGVWARLDESLFYPESGGQPADAGWLGARRVLDVQEIGGAVWQLLDGEPAAGRLAQRVDAARRRDHAEQHSGQHLLSAACVERLDAATVAFHMGEAVSTIELDTAELDDADLARVEERVAEIIREDRPIEALYPTPAEAAALPLRKETGVTENLRVVRIEGYDWSACGGTHLRRTGEIGVLFTGRKERIRGRWRVEFVAGSRARRAAAQALRRQRDLARALGCAAGELEERVAALAGEIETLRRAARRLRALELDAEAATLAADAAWKDAGGWRLLARDFGERPAAELGELARRLCEEPNRCLLAACREGAQGRLLFQRSRGEGPHLGALLKGLLAGAGGRGGGGPDRAQGGVEDPAAAARILADAARRLGER